jgi:two-component system NtrC family sensor kinase
LGLSISHDIIERHGGAIRVESKVGTGTTFMVSLPVDSERSTGLTGRVESR